MYCLFGRNAPRTIRTHTRAHWNQHGDGCRTHLLLQRTVVVAVVVVVDLGKQPLVIACPWLTQLQPTSLGRAFHTRAWLHDVPMPTVIVAHTPCYVAVQPTWIHCCQRGSYCSPTVAAPVLLTSCCSSLGRPPASTSHKHSTQTTPHHTHTHTHTHHRSHAPAHCHHTCACQRHARRHSPPHAVVVGSSSSSLQCLQYLQCRGRVVRGEGLLRARAW